MKIVPSRYAGTCALCLSAWNTGTPIAPFGDTSEHAGRWGHPACVSVDEMGLPSVDAVKERVARRDAAIVPAGVVDHQGRRSMNDLGWWTISGEELQAALRRAHEGEHPDLVYAELYANSDIERPAEEDES